MNEIDKSKPVVVTGSTGYLAAWIVKQLLDEGITVHATVRNRADKSKYAFLEKIAGNTGANIRFFEADLEKEGSFDEALRGCELVIHTASPFKLTGIKDPEKQLVLPAVMGTRNVLNSAMRSESVKRVVLTSSMAAVYGDAADCRMAEGGILTEKNWNTTSTLTHQPYSLSKTRAEQEAWKMAGNQDKWDLVVINPGFILGPSLDKGNGGFSNSFMAELGNGKYRMGLPGGTIGIVDVRDTAKAHILAGFNPSAGGRHITAGYNKSLVDISKILRQKFPRLPLPSTALPKPVAWMVGPLFGFSRKYVSLNFNIDLNFDNSYVKTDLGLTFTPLELTLTGHFEQLISDGLIKQKY